MLLLFPSKRKQKAIATITIMKTTTTMSTKRTIFPLVFAFFFLFSAMSCQEQQNDGVDDLKNLPEKSAQLIDADNQFGLELFRKVAGKAGANDNTMISPLSISLALSMTYNGAAGETKTDMAKALKLNGLTPEQINNSHQALVEALKSADPDVALEIANAIYYDKNLKVQEDFVTLNKKHYDAAVTALDFRSPVEALKTINGWVSEKTHEKIPTIIDQIEPELVMILLNAVYFNGIWKSKFGDKDTHPLPFRHGDGSTKEVATMSQETALEYSSNDLFSAVHLPYGKGQYQMTVLLPNAGKTTSDLMAALDNEKWKDWMGEFRMKEKVVVKMPRFKFSWKMTLNEILSSMGMTSAFTPYVADFSGINGGRDLYIGYVIHKTYVDVNENGTEAAAVTAVGMFTTSMPADPPEKIYFTVDRPFLFAITEKTTGTILFMGEMNAPEYN